MLTPEETEVDRKKKELVVEQAFQVLDTVNVQRPGRGGKLCRKE